MKGVIANSFPKSGTHILVRILELLEYKHADTHLSRSLIFYGPRNILRNIQIYSRIEHNPNEGIQVDIETPLRRVKNKWFISHMQKFLSGETYAKAHLPFTEKLEQCLIELKLKMLYIHRDPKDSLVSMKNYILANNRHPNHKMFKDLSSEEERLALILNGYNRGSNVNLIAPFLEKYNRSIGWKDSKACCSLEFEKIVGPKGGGNQNAQREQLLKVLAYLGKDAELADDIQEKVFNTKSITFHKGIIGQWREEFSPSIEALFQEKLSSTFTTGHEFSY